MIGYERSYGTARTVLSILEVIGWIAVGLGVLFVLLGFAAAAEAQRYFGPSGGMSTFILAVLPGIAISLAGLFAVTQTQVGRAGVDSAELARESLKYARLQYDLAVAAQSKGAGTASPSQAVPPPPKPSVVSRAPLSSAPAESPTPDESTPWRSDPRRPGLADPPVLAATYRGSEISLRADGYHFDGKWFATVGEAKNAIDGALLRQSMPKDDPK